MFHVSVPDLHIQRGSHREGETPLLLSEKSPRNRPTSLKIFQLKFSLYPASAIPELASAPSERERSSRTRRCLNILPPSLILIISSVVTLIYISQVLKSAEFQCQSSFYVFNLNLICLTIQYPAYFQTNYNIIHLQGQEGFKVMD